MLSRVKTPVRYVSFDLDGTLVDEEFTTLVWHDGIPELYARSTGMDIAAAREMILREYDGVGDATLEWYDISYWFKRLGISERWEDLLERHASMVRVYPEVHDVLGRLATRLPMIVLSNAAREFVEIEIEMGGLSDYFEKVVSATSDLNMVKKHTAFYRTVCDMMGVAPHEILHVGDHWEHDFQAPLQAGVQALCVDRYGRRSGDGILRDLRHLEEILNGI